MKHLYKIFFLSLIFLIANSFKSNGQSPEWIWAKSGGGTGMGDIAKDSKGNIYITGTFEGSFTRFAKDTIYNQHPFGNYNNMFIIKQDPNGNLLWARSVGNNATTGGVDITTDANDNVFVTGYFIGPSVTFDNIILNRTSGNDIFIAKYDPYGNVIWAKTATGNGDDGGSGLITDKLGNCYVTGYFRGSPITFDTVTLQSTGFADVFLVKYDPDGNVVWAKSGNGTGTNNSKDITIDAEGNITICGYFDSPTLRFDNVLLSNFGEQNDIFLVQYDSFGNVRWGLSEGGKENDECTGITADNNGNIFITGKFSSSSLTLEPFTLTNADDKSTDMFIAKFNNEGKVLWAQSAGGISPDEGTDIASDVNENIYATGHFSSPSITFGNTTLQKITYSRNIYIVQFNTSGDVIKAIVSGGPVNNNSPYIIIDDTDNWFISGQFASSITFGTIKLKEPEGSQNIFVSKFGIKPASNIADFKNTTLSIFPNPTKSTFHISGIEPGNWKITIYSLTGEKIHDSLLKDSQTIDLSGKAKGMYVYQLQKDGEVLKTGKIVIE